MSAEAEETPAAEEKASGLLGAVERIGNKVPHPVLMFGYLILLVIVLSWGLSLAGVSVTEQVAVPIAEGAPDTQLVPLVAGLAELQPWVEQWHSELDPTFGVSPAQFAREQLSEHLKSLGLTVDDLAAWRPPAPTRGRRAAK